jgi:hypothetical protein
MVLSRTTTGEVSVQSNADPTRGQTGTTFTVALPRHPPQDEAAENLDNATGQAVSNLEQKSAFADGK